MRSCPLQRIKYGLHLLNRHCLIYLNPSIPVIGCQSCWNRSKTFKIKKYGIGSTSGLYSRITTFCYIFIIDISEEFSDGSELVLYADDTTIWREILCDMDQTKLQNGINIQGRQFPPSPVHLISLVVARRYHCCYLSIIPMTKWLI